MSKAVVIVIEDHTTADSVARLIGATLTLNGYNAGAPAVIPWGPFTACAVCGSEDFNLGRQEVRAHSICMHHEDQS